MTNSKRHVAVRKPDWRRSMGLHPDFPLFVHGDKAQPNRLRWAKKVRRKLIYFGKLANDPKGQAALAEWDRVKAARLAGREPRPKVNGIVIAELCDRFLQAKDQLVDEGSITAQTRRDYKRVTDRLVAHFGDSRVVVDLSPEDFAALRTDFTKTNGLVSLANFIQRVRIVFKFGYDAELLPHPVKFGPMFKRPTKKAFRIQRAKSPPKLFTPNEVKRLLGTAGVQLKAMILLAINTGAGNNDCAMLEYRHLNLEAGWIHQPRVKTGTKRRCPLWPETVAALRKVLETRKQPKNEDHAELVFITRFGDSWAKVTDDRPVTKEFAKLAKAEELQQAGRGFYSLRHTFRTVAGAAKDLEATRALMGHINDHVEDAYIESLPDDDRLHAVTDNVRAWLFAPTTKDNAKPARAGKTKKDSPALRVVG